MEEHIFTARMRMLMRQWPTVWAGNLSVQVLFCIILWPFFSHQTILFWFAANLMLFGYRLLMRQGFERSIREGHGALGRWARNYVLSAVLGGFAWGILSWLFFASTNDPATLFILLVLIGVSVGAMPALSSYSPAYWAFSSAILLPTVLRLISLEGQFAEWIAILTLILLATILFYSRQLEKTITEAITTDLRNQQLLRELSMAHEVAQTANRSKSEFLANVSHDLRQPLHAMGLFMESLGRNIKPPHQQTLDQIKTAHHSLTSMFDALLDFSRLDSGAVQPIRTHFPVETVLNDLSNNFLPVAREKGLILSLDECPVVAYSDSVLLYDILGNLIGNAIKYTQKGSVHINYLNQEEHIVLRVTDSGCGIPEADQERIFSAYEQLHNPERDAEKGLGLGLAMVRETCRLLNHSIHLESIPGKGATFSITVPKGDPCKVVLPTPSSLDQSLQDLHIMLIDDDRSIRQATSELLNHWGCTVSSGDNLDEACNAMRRVTRPVDVVIADYRLAHNQTGIDAIKEVRALIDPELPAMVITGEPQLDQLKKEGFYVLQKPLHPSRLKTAILTLTQT